MTALEAPDLTPAERRRHKVRGSILEAAERVFADAGAGGLSIRRLAEEIDYSPAAIYKYFGSKEELIDELKEAFFGRILTQIGQVQQMDLSYGARARRSIEVYIETAMEKPHHYAAAFSSVGINAGDPGASTPPFTWSQFMTANKGRAFAYLIEMVEEGIASGDLRVDLDPLLAAKSIWVSSHGAAQLMTCMPHFPMLLPEGRTSSTKDFLAYHADVVVRGLEAVQIDPRNVKTAEKISKRANP